jgi:murein DD-endopeptidase MepM/ murein hydrolase activator NlpD
MKIQNIVVAVVALLSVSVAVAQEADSVGVAQDSLKRDSVARVEYQPVRSVPTLGKVSVIDTLPTENKSLSIILFNNNTWRYILSEDYKEDATIFSDHWSTDTIHAYADIPVDSLPVATAIKLVDSLESHHFPYMGRISSRYGMRRGRPHQGLDLSLKTGDPIYAAFDGKVRVSKYAGNYGNLIVVRHNNGLETYYAHLSERLVEPNDRVVAGQQIGKGGSTGRSSGPHLHFETRYKGQSFDPERLFDFKTGELRNSEILLKRRHFSIHSKFEQDFNEEEEVAKQEAAERAAATAAKPATAQYHTIVAGDTFGSLARKYNTTSEAIQKLNPGVEPTKIRIGQRICVRGTGAATNSNATYHVVKSGDTFSHIAAKYHTTSKRIQELNPKVDPAKIQIGQKIRVK